MLTASLVNEAIAFLQGRVITTPVEPSPALSKIMGVPVWLKLEFLQTTGSFKLRGALFRMSKLTDAERRGGIYTCSAGNHGKAIAYAAKAMGVHATICVPSSVDEAKYRGMIDLGAEVRVSEFAGYDETEDWAIAEAQREGKPFLSAFDDHMIMAASGGSLAAECLAQVPDARTFIIPTGGGGLAAGFAFHTGMPVICVQHEGSPGLQRSLDTGVAVTRLPAIETSAGGIEGGLGRLPFEVLRSRVDRVVHVSESQIEDAVRWVLENHQYVIEPSSAAAIAACLNGVTVASAAIVVLTGRNVAARVLRRILGA